jgi:hypothetical protein
MRCPEETARGEFRPEIALVVVTTEVYNRATYLLIGGRVGKKGEKESRTEVTLKARKGVKLA